jgi:uncharacterized membrane protein
MINRTTKALILTSLVLSAAIFGFFYAWVCSTMWGLDQADPHVSIQAMQAMNASVRNAVFAPAFFGTPFALGLTAFALSRQRLAKPALLFSLSAGIYAFFGLGLTMAINVPMNEALAVVAIPTDTAEASKLWSDYSVRWQFWNQTRTIASGLSFLLAVYAVLTCVPKTEINR